jgi:hypothetical protein
MYCMHNTADSCRRALSEVRIRCIVDGAGGRQPSPADGPASARATVARRCSRVSGCAGAGHWLLAGAAACRQCHRSRGSGCTEGAGRCHHGKLPCIALSCGRSINYSVPCLIIFCLCRQRLAIAARLALPATRCWQSWRAVCTSPTTRQSCHHQWRRPSLPRCLSGAAHRPSFLAQC